MLDYKLQDGVAIVTMDDGKANALSYEMIDAVMAALRRAEREASAMVLAGAVRENPMVLAERIGAALAGRELTTGDYRGSGEASHHPSVLLGLLVCGLSDRRGSQP